MFLFFQDMFNTTWIEMYTVNGTGHCKKIYDKLVKFILTYYPKLIML